MLLLLVILTGCVKDIGILTNTPKTTIPPTAINSVLPSQQPELISIYKHRISESYDYDSWYVYLMQEYNLNLKVNKLKRLSDGFDLPIMENCITVLELNDYFKIYINSKDILKPLNNLDVINLLNSNLTKGYQGITV